jgi:uncharacterized protein (UPF0335 family)
MGRPLGSKNKGDGNGDRAAGFEVPLRNSVSGDDLRPYLERIERLNAEQKELSADRSQIYSELKTAGYDRKTVQEIVKRRKLTAEQRQNSAALLDMYLSALGDFADTPLGQAGAKQMREEHANDDERRS